LTLLFDENIPQSLAEALRALNHDVKHIYDPDVNMRSAGDPDIFRRVGIEGWGLVTRDKKIRKRPHERAAYLSSGIGVFIFTGSAEHTLEEQMVQILKVIGEIEDHATRVKPPYIFGISDKGKMERLE
jgi:predicted nuclease of predicted toxin-antitoxin system